jgi:hypothetical protein
MQLTKQGVRDLDALDRKKPYVPPALTEHKCKQWRWFNPPKGSPEEVAPEMKCVLCQKLWHDKEAPVPVQVASLEKIAPGLKKTPKVKKEALVQTTLKAPLVR